MRRYVVQIEADGRSPHTVGQYRRHVRTFVDWYAPRDDAITVTHEHIAAFFASTGARQRADGGAKTAGSVNSMRQCQDQRGRVENPHHE